MTLWKLREITLLIFPQGMLPLKGPTAAKLLSLSIGILPQMITSKNWLEKASNWPQKRKNKIGNSTIVGCIKKKKLWFGLNNNPVLSETLKFPLLTTVHELNHWSTDKMTAFLNHH